jgi:hypothetical protein
MALFGVSFSFVDEDGHQTERTWYVEAASISAAHTRAVALAGLIGDVINGAFLPAYYIRDPGVLTSLTVPLVAAAGSEVEIKAVLTMGRGAGAATFTIPTLDKDAWTVPGGNIDLTETEWVALETELVGQGWADYRGGDYTSIRKAVEGFG